MNPPCYLGRAALSEITPRRWKLKVSNLYFAGEVLDVDGDTGGYNLQFAFSQVNGRSKQPRINSNP
jgi:predicted flavoprotein YhiN